MSFSKNVQHLVFATKSRRPTLVAAHRRVAYAIMWEILKKMNVFVYRIGGVEDHVHILCDVPGTVGISEIMNRVKGASSHELKQDDRFSAFDGWARSYFSRSCSVEEIPVITQYIQNQESHHRKISWRDEMREFILRAGGDPAVLDRLMGDESRTPPTGG